MRFSLVSLLIVASFACTKEAPAPAPTPTTTLTPTTTEPKKPAVDEHGFIEDDADAAFAAAKAAGKLVFVDVWAPWCHTCLSMDRDVLSQPPFLAFADRLVFLAVDTDREENAGFLARFTVKVWPTFFVIDPTTDAPLAVHPGSMGLNETVAFLNEALKTRDPSAQNDALVRALLLGHQALAKNDPVTATKHYAIAAAAEGPRRSEAILAGLRAFALTDDAQACVDFGDRYADVVKGGGAVGDALSYVLACVEKLPDAKKPDARKALRARLTAVADKPAVEASVDDQADVLANLANVEESLGDTASAKKHHEQRLNLLEDDAAKQTTTAGQQVHDYARMNSLLALDRGDEAVALFQKRTQEQPTNYEPWARLASTLHKLKRDDDAKAAVDRAIALSYGTRHLRYLNLLADIEDGRGDAKAAAAARQQLLDAAAKLPAVLRDEKLIAATQTKLTPTNPTTNPTTAPAK